MNFNLNLEDNIEIYNHFYYLIKDIILSKSQKISNDPNPNIYNKLMENIKLSLKKILYEIMPKEIYNSIRQNYYLSNENKENSSSKQDNKKINQSKENTFNYSDYSNLIYYKINLEIIPKSIDNSFNDYYQKLKNKDENLNSKFNSENLQQKISNIKYKNSTINLHLYFPHNIL